MATRLFNRTLMHGAHGPLDFVGNVLESSTELSIIVKDLDGKVLLWNEGARRMYGYEAEEVLGRSISLLAPPDRTDEATRLIGELRRGKTIERYETFRTRKDGRLIDVSLTLTPIRDRRGRVIGASTIARDVTEEKQVQVALRESRARLAAILESAMDGIISIDDDQRIVLFNAAAERIFGYRAAEVLGQPLDRLLPERYRAAHADHVRSFRRTGMTTHRLGAVRPITGLRSNGEEVPLEASISHTETGGRTISSVILRDVTERLRAERQLREQANLIDHVLEAIIVHDLEGRVVFWSQGARRMYGWEEMEALGKNGCELCWEEGPELAEVNRAVLEQGEWVGDMQQVTRDGRALTVQSHWALVRDEEGRPRAKLIINTDVTERQQLEAQLLRTQRLESIGTLAGGIAHDLNNLLTPILMVVELLGKDRPDEDRQGLLGMLRTSAERAAEMVRHLLAFAGGAKGRQTTVQLRHVIREVQGVLGPLASKAVQVRITVPNDLWPVHGDPTQLSQVLMNLCVNALDVMPTGGALTIAAENTILDDAQMRMFPDVKAGPVVLLTVTDTGPGIPPEVLDRVFDPFFTTKGPGKGTGLGLSTAMGIVKGHGGGMSVSSNPGRGARFVVCLPAELAPRAAQEQKAPPELPAGHGELILVVDDEALILQAVQATLEEHGYRVIVARDGGEALLSYQQRGGEVRAVVLDLMMPGVNGLTALRALRELAPRLPILAVSGLPPTGQAADLVTAGATAFLQKPLTAEGLLEALGRVMVVGF